jgi:hypothetical protein
MGSSPSIKQLEEKQTEFDNYRKKLQSELSAETTKTVESMEAEVKKYYSENGWKGEAYLAGRSYDFMQASEWSLANVKAILESVSKAMLGQQSNPPSGVTITPTEEAKAALKEMENMELYLVGKAFQIIAGVIESFGSATEVKFKSETIHKPLGNGFHLFLAVSQNSYRSKDFLNNESIYEYLYIYQVRFSHEEALEQAEISLTELYENEIAVFKGRIEHVLKSFEKEELTPKQYKGLQAEYEELIERSEGLLKKLGPSKTAALVRA